MVAGSFSYRRAADKSGRLQSWQVRRVLTFWFSFYQSLSNGKLRSRSHKLLERFLKVSVLLMVKSFRLQRVLIKCVLLKCVCFLLLLSAISCVQTLVSGAVSRVWNMRLHDSWVRQQLWLAAAWCDIYFQPCFPTFQRWIQILVQINSSKQFWLCQPWYSWNVTAKIGHELWMQFKIGLDGNSVCNYFESL